MKMAGTTGTFGLLATPQTQKQENPRKPGDLPVSTNVTSGLAGRSL